MKNTSYSALILAILFASAIESNGAITTVNFDSGGTLDVRNSNGTTQLTAGVLNTNGDGAVLQLGYFNSGTAATPFSGTWVPLTGAGGANSGFATTSIGDLVANGANGNGLFANSVTFDPAVAGRNASLPAAGMPLGIRIYNNTSLATSTFYLTISSGAANWLWQTPANAPLNPVLNLSFDDNVLVRENGTAAGSALPAQNLRPANTFSTTIPVPEPSFIVLQGLAALSGLALRHRGRRLL